jgi:hypothetical protein
VEQWTLVLGFRQDGGEPLREGHGDWVLSSYRSMPVLEGAIASEAAGHFGGRWRRLILLAVGRRT